MKYFNVLLLFGFSIMLSCKKNNPTPDSLSVVVSGDWNHHESLLITTDSQGNIIQPNGIAVLAYPAASMTHRLENGVLSLYVVGNPQAAVEHGSYTDSTITFGTNSQINTTYQIVSVSSTTLVIERSEFDNLANSTVTFKRTFKRI